MAKRDPYDVLGLPKGASDEEIKRAFRALARACHPDVAGPESAGRFHEIREAYETLSDCLLYTSDAADE